MSIWEVWQFRSQNLCGINDVSHAFSHQFNEFIAINELFCVSTQMTHWPNASTLCHAIQVKLIIIRKWPFFLAHTLHNYYVLIDWNIIYVEKCERFIERPSAREFTLWRMKQVMALFYRAWHWHQTYHDDSGWS